MPDALNKNAGRVCAPVLSKLSFREGTGSKYVDDQGVSESSPCTTVWSVSSPLLNDIEVSLGESGFFASMYYFAPAVAPV